MTKGAGSGNMGKDLSQPTPLSVATAASMMGLDPIKLEQRYLVLCSIYTAHMVQGKEATEVAMKHVI